MSKLSQQLDRETAHWGNQMMALAHRLYPVCRAQTGDGLRETLHILQETIPLEVHEVSTGTEIFDWQVPQEWNISAAYIADEQGNRLIDFTDSNLHIVLGSVPIQEQLSWQDLKSHLFVDENHPQWIPFRTAYGQNTWGFCLTAKQFQHLESLSDHTFTVVIDSSYQDGSLTYGELVLPGETEQECLFYTHICHPSLANDNLSGIAILSALYQLLAQQPNRLTYRFVLAPATIGAITWLSQNQKQLDKIKHGLILSCLGDAGNLTYKRSRRGNADIDHAAEYVLSAHTDECEIRNYEPFGYDERQFCSPGINLPMGRLTRTPDGEYQQYHTSADDLDLISSESLLDSLRACLSIIQVIEQNKIYQNLRPYCEPRLDRYDLYSAYGSSEYNPQIQRAVQWVLNQSAGDQSLLEITQTSKMTFTEISQAASLLSRAGLIQEINQSDKACNQSVPSADANFKHSVETREVLLK